MANLLALTLIIENKNDLEGAAWVVNRILEVLPPGSQIADQMVYPKFERAYKFEVEIPITTQSEMELLRSMVEMSASICKPWLIYWDKADTEMIFNAGDPSSFTLVEGNVIRWAHLRQCT